VTQEKVKYVQTLAELYYFEDVISKYNKAFKTKSMDTPRYVCRVRVLFKKKCI